MNLFKFFSFSFHTHNERRQADVPLCGRSMVEMLGVLAIIGVLSVGAISGYSKAMMKYKLNKQTEQMNTIINTVVQYYDELKATDVSGESYYLLPLLKKLNVIPEDMYIKNDEYFIKDVLAYNIAFIIIKPDMSVFYLQSATKTTVLKFVRTFTLSPNPIMLL